MGIIINNLETEEKVADYKDWIQNKHTSSIKRLKKMLETDRKHRPYRWKNGDHKIHLMNLELLRRGEGTTIRGTSTSEGFTCRKPN